MTERGVRVERTIVAPGNYLVCEGNHSGQELYLFGRTSQALADFSMYKAKYRIRVRAKYIPKYEANNPRYQQSIHGPYAGGQQYQQSIHGPHRKGQR